MAESATNVRNSKRKLADEGMDSTQPLSPADNCAKTIVLCSGGVWQRVQNDKDGNDSFVTEISDDSSDMDLMSKEKLDRSSPEIWPEQIPGVSKFVSLAMHNQEENPPADQPDWLKDFDQDDISILQGFGSLTAAALLEKVRDIQNLAYQLGLEESKEMTRGRFLGILPKKRDIRR